MSKGMKQIKEMLGDMKASPEEQNLLQAVMELLAVVVEEHDGRVINGLMVTPDYAYHLTFKRVEIDAEE